MGVARIRMTGEFLRELLALPITSVVRESLASERDREVLIIVEDPALPDPDEGVMCEAIPTFRRNQPVEFVNWNVQKGGAPSA